MESTSGYDSQDAKIYESKLEKLNDLIRGQQRSKMSTVNNASSVMAGFAMVVVVELDITEEDYWPSGLIIACAVVTSLLMVVHVVAFMISTLLLPTLEPGSQVSTSKGILITLAWNCSTFGMFLLAVDVVLICWAKFKCVSLAAAILSTLILGVPALIAMVCMLWNQIQARKERSGKKEADDKKRKETHNFSVN